MSEMTNLINQYKATVASVPTVNRVMTDELRVELQAMNKACSGITSQMADRADRLLAMQSNYYYAGIHDIYDQAEINEYLLFMALLLNGRYL